ncbi:MAG: tetratricopeptide repeat protein, partial [Gemmataceae bacterium]|nr:tetratricopeptide repeat protein [Gemmataceae bacterium]
EKDRAAELAKMLAAAPTPGAGGPAGGPVSRDVAASAARSLDQGITAYKAGRYEEAERSLATATTANPADAVGWYFLGAARWTLGKRDDAREAFRRGAGAESARVVPVRVIDAAVGPIQGPARDALAAERP